MRYRSSHAHEEICLAMEADQQKSLSKEALRVKEGAYCRYSKFHVGAALLCRDGTVFTGRESIDF